MRPTKLTEVLSQLTQTELKKFRKFINSPYFHQHKDTITFFEALAKYHPDYHHDKVTSEIIYEAVFPGQAYDDGKVRTLRKYLHKLLNTFLSLESFLESPHEVEKHQINTYLDKGLTKYVPKGFDTQRDILTKQLLLGPSKYLELFVLEDKILQFRVEHEDRWENTAVLKPMEHLDHFFILEKLMYACSLHTYGSIFKNVPTDLFLIQDITEYCEQHFDSLPSIIQAYTLSLKLVSGRAEEEDLEILQGIVKEGNEHFEIKDLINFYVIIVNYCSFTYRRGRTEALSKMFEVYKDMITYGILAQTQKGLLYHFKNLVTLGLKLKEYQWTETFIEDWIKAIPEENQTDIYHFSRANLFTHTGEYTKALKELQEATFIDPFYRIGYYTLLFKIHFEQNEEEAFLALVNTYRTYLRRRSGLTEERKQPYKEFIRLGKEVFQAKRDHASGANGSLRDIRTEVQESKSLVEKEWLLEKLDMIP